MGIFLYGEIESRLILIVSEVRDDEYLWIACGFFGRKNPNTRLPNLFIPSKAPLGELFHSHVLLNLNSIVGPSVSRNLPGRSNETQTLGGGFHSEYSFLLIGTSEPSTPPTKNFSLQRFLPCSTINRLLKINPHTKEMLLRRMDLTRGGRNELFASVLFFFFALASCQIENPPSYSYHNMPQTRFTCEGKLPGRYYADQETDCQLFHVCVKMRRDLQDFKFLCPNGTVFDQEHLVCADFYQVVCHSQVGNNPFGQIFELFKLSASKPDIGLDIRVPERDPDYLGQNTLGGEEFQAEEYNNNKLASSANSLPFADDKRRPFTNSPTPSTSSSTPRPLVFRSPLPPKRSETTRRPPAVTTTTTTTTTTPTTTRITTQRTYDDDFFTQQSTAFPFNPFDTVEISTSAPLNPAQAFSNTRRPAVFQSTFRTSLPILSSVTNSPLNSQPPTPTFQQQSTRFSDEFFVKLPITSRPKPQEFRKFQEFRTTEEPFYTTTTTRTPTTTDRFYYTTTQDSFVRPTTFNPSSFQKSNSKFSLKTMNDGKSKFLVKPTEIPSSLESETLPTLNYFEPKKSGNNNLVFYNEDELAETTTPLPTTTTLRPRRLGRRRKVNGQKNQFRPFDPQVKSNRRSESRANQQRETVFVTQNKPEEIFSAEASVFPGRPKGNIILNGETPLPQSQRKDGSEEPSRENKEKFKKPTFNGDAFGRRIRPFIRDFNKQEGSFIPDEEKPLRRRRPSTTTTVATTTIKSENFTSTTVTSTTRQDPSTPQPPILSPSTLKPGRIQIRTKTVFGGPRKSQDPSSTIFLAEPRRIVTSTEEPELITASDEDIAAKKSGKNSQLKLTVITTPLSVLFKPANSTQTISVKSVKKSESSNQQPFTKKVVKVIKSKPKEKIPEKTPENDVEFGTRSPDYDYSYYNTDDELAITSDVAKHDKELFIKKN